MVDVVDYGNLTRPVVGTADGTPEWLRVLGGSTASGIGGALAAGGRYISEKMGADNVAEFLGAVEQYAGATSEDIIGSISPASRAAFESAILSEDFMNQPFTAAYLKTVGMTPMIAVSLIPGGLVAGTAAKVAAVAVTGGAINAAQVVDGIYAETDKKNDTELKALSPRYAALRELHDERDARSQFNGELMGVKPVINFLVGAGSMAIGPAGKIAGLWGKGATGLIGQEAGVLGRTAAGFSEAAVGGAAQGGAANYSIQSAGIEAGVRRELDKDALVNAVLEPALLGGVMGGGINALAGRRGTREPKPVDRPPQTEPPAAAPRAFEPSIPMPPDPTAPGARAAPDAPPPVSRATPPPPTDQIARPAVEPRVAPEPVTAITPEAAVVREAVTPEPRVAPEPARAAEPVIERTPVEPTISPEVAKPAALAPPVEPTISPEVVKPAALAPPEAPVPVKKTGRILPNTTKEAQALRREQQKQLQKNFEAAEAEVARAADDYVPDQKKGKAHLAKQQAADNAARQVFEKYTAEPTTVPTDMRGVEALRDRLEAALKEATELGAKVPGHVTTKTSDHGFWLREVSDVLKSLRQVKKVTPERLERVANFLAREAAGKAGDWAAARSERRAEGEAKMRRFRGDVGEKGPADTTGTKQAAVVGAETETTGPVTIGEYPEQRVITKKDGTKEVVEGVKAVTRPVSPELLAEYNKRFATPGTKTNPVQAETAKDVAKAAKQVERAPTGAQKEAGNYKKGHFDHDGLSYAIETPRGVARTGKDAAGKDWSVKMEDDYGYVKRTEGADGDGVDVFVGKKLDSDKVFVIDQRDLGTGRFDEHKAMVGYESSHDALAAYDRAFNDGRGAERVMDITTMSKAEFREWLKDREATKKPAAGEQHEITSARLGAPPDTVTLTDQRTGTEEKFTVRAAGKASEFLDLIPEHTVESFSAIPRGIYDFFVGRLRKFAGDTDVYVLRDADMAAVYGPRAVGGHRLTLADGRHTIVMPESIFDRPNEYRHSLIHEMAHVVTVRGLVESRTLFRQAERLAEMVANRAIEDLRTGKLSFAEYDKLQYGLEKGPLEFMAEVFSNQHLQNYMADLMIPSAWMQMFDRGVLPLSKESVTAWSAFRDLVKRAIAKVFGSTPPGLTPILDAVLAVGRSLEDLRALEVQRGDSPVVIDRDNYAAMQRYQTDTSVAAAHVDAVASNLELNVLDKVRQAIANNRDPHNATPYKWSLKISTLDYLARRADELWGGAEKNPVRRVGDAIEKIRVKAQELFDSSGPLVRETKSLQDKYSQKIVGKDAFGDPETMWDRFTRFIHDESAAQVFADRDLSAQKHIGKNDLAGTWARARHPELAREYNALPTDLQALRRKTHDFFTAKQNDMAFGILKNRVLKVLGFDDEGMARRIFDDTATDADKKVLGDAYDLIKEAKVLSKLAGPYVPFMRRGNWVVRGVLKTAEPPNAIKLAPNEFEFSSRKEAMDYAAQQQHLSRPDVRSVWVEEKTGREWVPDPDGGVDHKGQPKLIKITPQDIDAVQRWRVTVQDQFMDMFPTRAKAEEARAKLLKNPEFELVKEVVERKFEPRDFHTDMLSHQVEALFNGLKKRKSFHDLPDQIKAEMVAALSELSMRVLGSTRIQSRRLPRRYVAGYSTDVTRNMVDYSISSAGYLAKLEFQPKLDAALKDMHATVDNDQLKGSTTARSMIANEIDRRVAANVSFADEFRHNPALNRLKVLSFLDKLWGPSHTIINLSQVSLTTMPLLAGKYGAGRAFNALAKAYRDVNSKAILGEGLKNMVQAAKQPFGETPDMFATIRRRAKTAEERAFLDEAAAVGAIDANAGLEIAKLIRSEEGLAGKLDVGLGYLEGIARAMPAAAELVNRSVTGLATFRLEMARSGGDTAASTIAAIDAIRQTQFVYSNTNAPPIFNHPVMSLSLQFKKFGLGMYQFMAEQVATSLHGASREERIAAMKTLGYIAAMHVAAAGTLGLPTEPVKYLLFAANRLGLTKTEFSDIERWWRSILADTLGKSLGEVAARGIPRAFGVDVSSRVGLDSLLTFGEPKTAAENDVKAWVFNTVVGAPVNLVFDWFKGANLLANGEYVKGAEHLIPMKQAADALRAYRQWSGGKKTETGRETMTPYTAGEVVTRLAGFTPAREAENFEKRGAFFNQQKQESGERAVLVAKWITGDKKSAWQDIRKFNAGKPLDAQITLSDLTAAASKRTTEDVQRAKSGGLRTTRRDTYTQRSVERIYN